MTPRGRRPGDAEQTRAAILEAARREFAAKGYDATSLRGIARGAGVDPALVHHYFAGKADVFTHALSLPVNIPERVRELLELPRDRIGENIVAAFLTLWDEPATREQLQGLIRAAVTEPQVGRMLREFIVRGALEPVAAALGRPDPELAAAAAAAQMVGLALFRYVVPHPPLVGSAPADLARLVGPTIQRYLTGDPLPGHGAPGQNSSHDE